MIRSGTPRKLEFGNDEHVVHLYGSPCEQARLIEPYVCRRLRPWARTRFETHFFSCERCLHAVEFELFIKRAVVDFAKIAQFSRSWH
jgi:hypothetical protein